MVKVGINDLASQNPELAKEFHPTLNGELTPQQIARSSKIKIWWLCPLQHEYYASSNNRSQGKGCPVCAGKVVLQGYNDLGSDPQFKHLIKEWHPTKNGDQTPFNVTKYTSRKIWWRCSLYGHEYQARIDHRTVEQSGCPFCSGRSVLVGFNDLGSLTEHKDLIAEWHPNKNTLTPSDVTYGSQQSIWWQCPKGHQWKSTIINRTKGRGCRKCSLQGRSKIELAFLNEVRRIFMPYADSTRIVHANFPRGINVDMYGKYKEHSVVIEYDGLLYHGSKYGKEAAHRKDLLKTQALLDLGLVVIRIRENDLFHLDIRDKNLLQVTSWYEEGFKNVPETTQEIYQWLNTHH